MITWFICVSGGQQNAEGPEELHCPNSQIITRL